MNLENLNVQLNFICPPYLETQESSNVDDKRLMAYFKVIHAKSTLTKSKLTDSIKLAANPIHQVNFALVKPIHLFILRLLTLRFF